MKKILMMLVASAALAAQAEFTSVQAFLDDTTYGLDQNRYQAYVIDTTQMTGLGSATSATVLEWLQSNYNPASFSSSSVIAGSLAYMATKDDSMKFGADSLSLNGDAASYYFLALVENATDNKYYGYVMSNDVAYDGKLDFGSLSTSTDAAGWSPVGSADSVPEPTSGLLLLLGMAGLALKRRG